MCSVTLENNGSPKKRMLSRGMSEDESLRSIIKESETPTRRLTRSDSRGGTLRRRTDVQLDQDLLMGLPEMLELQASYDEAVQELRGLEVEREALLFQVDVLQDTLEGVEELLAEAQREAGQASLKLEQEREANRKLERLLCSLKQEVERLNEERKSQTAPLNGIEPSEQERQTNNNTDHLLCEACNVKIRSGVLENSEKLGEEEEEVPGSAGAARVTLQRLASQPFTHTPSLALGSLHSVDGVLQRPYDVHTQDGRDPSPDRNDSDSISAYEDASADTPEHERALAAGSELFNDLEDTKTKATNEDLDETENPRSPDSCILS
ncbi:uncharacterized protein si:ch1073-456m8.1 isoform X2 [Oryzias melastigma]|uniref:uncharacterized protein si:ch1073-456m8.1 isoform X2 n=1 Tax=Oryzias melastigma TaxID=30732 RepID=UPI000CF7EADE|nr:uncharacterized protein si:ch1073-456m8.1 isoform X2 [Oryzias melastigma]